MLIAIFRQFFLLGCMSFGGPAAHLGYFKRHFVDTLNWLTNTRYAQLISLSQALPGPGSSQVSFAIGVERAGVLGAVGAIWPLLKLNSEPAQQSKSKSNINWLALGLFTLLLALSFIPLTTELALFAPFYQAGAMVFGGGHVVLPVLQASVPALSSDQFLSAYASAQAVPGTMFTIATYLGAQLSTEQPLFGAIIATVLIFMPGFLLILAFQKSWLNLANKPRFASVIAALNASVVGFLAAALYSPIWTSAVHNFWHIALVIAAFAWLRLKKPPIWWLLILFIATGLAQYYWAL